MKIAIHHTPNSFSDRWIDYCTRKKINFKIVSCFDNNIVQQLKDCDALLWHHHHEDFMDVISAKKILFSLEHAGIKVFPDFFSSWHFDDKVAQKYLLEAINVPLVPSYVFYDKQKAIMWANKTTYPKVFKLKGGAGSANVKLVKNKHECLRFINKAFGKGFKQFDGVGYFLESIKKYNSGMKSFKQLIKAFGRMIISTKYSKNTFRERGYVYFQDFLKNNDSDIRVIVIGDKAFGLKRMVRKGDFRASGSGDIVYDSSKIDVKCVKMAFDANKNIKSQSIAYDFIFNSENNPLIVEISYAYSTDAYDKCEGYWTEDLQFHKGQFIPQDWIIEQLILSI